MTHTLTDARELLTVASAIAEADGRYGDSATYLGERAAVGTYSRRAATDSVPSVLLWSAAGSVERLADSAAAQDLPELNALDSAAHWLQSAALLAQEGGL